MFTKTLRDTARPGPLTRRTGQQKKPPLPRWKRRLLSFFSGSSPGPLRTQPFTAAHCPRSREQQFARQAAGRFSDSHPAWRPLPIPSGTVGRCRKGLTGPQGPVSGCTQRRDRHGFSPYSRFAYPDLKLPTRTCGLYELKKELLSRIAPVPDKYKQKNKKMDYCLKSSGANWVEKRVPLRRRAASSASPTRPWMNCCTTSCG